MRPHRLLARQIKKTLEGRENDPELSSFFELISEAYAQADADRELLERSLDLTSRELTTRNRELQARLSEQSQMKEAFELSNSLLQATLNATHDGLLVLDLEENIRLYNPTFKRMLGLPTSLRLESLSDLEGFFNQHDMLPHGFLRRLRESVNTPEGRHQFDLEMDAGAEFKTYIEMYSEPQFFGSKVVGQVWSFSDVSELRLKEEEAKHRAYHDLLTGLPNRRLMTQRLVHGLKQSAQHQQKLAVLFFDLDGFKDVNDYMGHATGDALLRETAKRIESIMPPKSILARQGGDEFVAVLEGLDNEAQAVQFASDVLDALNHPFHLTEDELFMSSSIGIAMYPDHGSDPDKLLSNADIAMYRAKRQGKNAFAVYNELLDGQSVHRVKVRSQINNALEHDQFELFFQPKISLTTGKIVGAEALIRWRMSDGSFRSPIEFIPTAEENGQIIPISQWLIRRCCRHLIDWQEVMPDNFVLALNISAKHFKRGVLQNDLAKALLDSGAEASKLELEVTETAIMDDVELAASTLEALNHLGIRTAIDDFGTGHSSLSYLRRLPIKILKIDKSFIDDILNSHEDETLVNGIISMVHALGIEVVAEGVENKNMADLLKTMQCDLAQGYYFCKPISEQEFIALLKRGQTYEV